MTAIGSSGVGASSPLVGNGTVLERMDRLPLTGLHIGIVVIAALGFAFDLVEVALGNALSAVFSAPPTEMDLFGR